MFKQLSMLPSRNEFSGRRLLVCILSTALITLFFTSAEGQVTGHSPDCNLGRIDAPVWCTGWIYCDFYTYARTITATAYADKRCPGYHVYNDAAVYTWVSLSGIGSDTYARLGSNAGKMLEYKNSSMSCLKTKSERSGILNPCPGAQSSNNLSSTFVASTVMPPTNQTDCQAAGYYWDFASNTCSDTPPPPTNQTDCTSIGWYWDFISNTCSNTPLPPTNQSDCASIGWYWDFSSNMCSSTPSNQTDCTAAGFYWDYANGICDSADDCTNSGGTVNFAQGTCDLGGGGGGGGDKWDPPYR